VRRVELSDREARILSAIIETHVRIARPVSSSAIVGERKIPLSSATVRNVMRSLEDARLISQPHTSAGRVPTDRGYRYYVDHLMAPVLPTGEERSVIAGELSLLAGRDPATILTEVSRTVSHLVKELAVSVAPTSGGLIDRVELASLGDDRVVAVATMRSGLTRSAALTPGVRLSDADLAETTRLLSSLLRGRGVAEAESTIRGSLTGMRPDVRSLLEALLGAGGRIFRTPEGDTVHYEGARYIFRHPEFLSDAACLGEILDNEDALADVVRGPSGPLAVTVTIGSENARRELRRMSLVVGTYRVGIGVGRMGFIGPTRMKYSRLVGLTEYIADALDRAFRPEAGRAGPATEGENAPA
jgi:heat-inducible transcriptional repressor